MGRWAYLALGANIGDKEKTIRQAVRLLETGGCELTAASSLYATKPVGYTDQPDFLNAVIAVETDLSPYELLALCNSVERKLGRERTIRWGPRVIDIDILLYEDVEISETTLTLPHPSMLQRAFVLVPLAEIAPDVEVADGLSAEDAVRLVPSEGVTLYHGPGWDWVDGAG
ncbi:MAG: 2-amino-4-hydroxy-6-hydroxymethyldihydropteridine diphosphokinase [Armatimonadota bacterium]|jgi:2-amino-4-hydroxy-6-hydroxymethyldihydropteridine diphosphokinase